MWISLCTNNTVTRRRRRCWCERRDVIRRMFLFFMYFLSRGDDSPRRVNYSDLQRGLDGRLRRTHNIEHRTEPVSH